VDFGGYEVCLIVNLPGTLVLHWSRRMITHQGCAVQELRHFRSNGQIVAYFDYGQSDDVVFLHHGTPSAGPIQPHIRRNADALGIEYFAILGGSGGGPHALASRHLAGSRCIAQLIIAGLAPFDDPNFDFVEGMSEENREEWNLPLISMEDFEAPMSKMATESSSLF
jgi:hypothetical protein